MKEVNTLKKFQKISKVKRINIYFPERELDKINILDNKENIINLKELFSKKNIPIFLDSVWGELIPMSLREGTALRLVKVAKYLYPHYILKIKDTFRPISFQRKQFEAVKKDILIKNPNLEKFPDLLYHETTKYSADPDGCPPHSTGGAVDLTLTDYKGIELDMGTPIDTISELAQTFHKRIYKKAKENRKILYKAMVKKGFVNMPTEWWHYSYGDQYWAAFLNKKYARYGKTEKNL